MNKSSFNDVLRLLDGCWQVDYWRLPELDTHGDVVGHVRWSLGAGATPEPGGRRGLLFSPDALLAAGHDPESPLLFVETADDLVAAMLAGFAGVSRPHLLGSFEPLAVLAQGRHVVVVAGGTGGGVLASSKICATVESQAASCVLIRPPLSRPSLAAWLGTIRSQGRARRAVLARVERAREGVC